MRRFIFAACCVITASILAAQTRLPVTVAVYLLALRHPVTTARSLSSINELAPGRLTLGVGIGGEDRHEMEVCGAMSRMASRGARLIAIDYIQEVGCSKTQQDRRNELRWLLKRLKAHARRLGVALIIVSQIRRQDERAGASKKPGKHSLKESGDLENSSEVVVVLWREVESDFAPLLLEVAKCKWGGVGERWSMQRSQATGRLEEVPYVVEAAPVRAIPRGPYAPTESEGE